MVGRGARANVLEVVLRVAMVEMLLRYSPLPRVSECLGSCASGDDGGNAVEILTFSSW